MARIRGLTVNQIERLRARRRLVLTRRQTLRIRRENASKLVRISVPDIEGRKRYAMVSSEVAALLRTREPVWSTGKFQRGMRVFAFSTVQDAESLSLDAGGPLSHIQGGRWSHGAWHEGSAGTYAQTGTDRRAARAWTATVDAEVVWSLEAAHMPAHAATEVRCALDARKLAWAQNRAGVEASRAFYRLAYQRKADAANARRAASAKANAPKLRSARWEAAKARQLAAIRDQRAALTAAAVASGELTND